jgi:hypothetical protein
MDKFESSEGSAEKAGKDAAEAVKDKCPNTGYLIANLD